MLGDVVNPQDSSLVGDVDPGVAHDVDHPRGDHALGGHVLPRYHVAACREMAVSYFGYFSLLNMKVIFLAHIKLL